MSRTEFSTDVQGAQGTSSQPSLQNPTREYLRANFKKTELQKHCRELGFTKVWETKEKLVEMILQKADTRDLSALNLDDETETSSLIIQRLMKDIQDIKEQLSAKEIRLADLERKLIEANVTIDGLYCRVTSLEEKRNMNESGEKDDRHGNNVSCQLPDRTFLLGDFNYSKIKLSDLNDKCTIRTIIDANIDLLKCWIEEKLTWIPAKTILYCGSQDILDGSPPDSVIENLGALVATLREKNENMEIFICELVPSYEGESLISKVKEFNNKLVEWTYHNKINLIKTDLPFRLGTGEIDDMCIENLGSYTNYFPLSRYGVVRLLSTIHNQYPNINLCPNIDNIKRNPFDSNPSKSNENLEIANNFRPVGIRTNAGPYVSKENGTDRLRNRQSRVNYHSSRSHGENSRYHPIYNSNNNYDYRYRKNPHSAIGKQGCYNCGEFNHNQSTCRYDHKIKCISCNQLGHKNRLCYLYKR